MTHPMAIFGNLHSKLEKELYSYLEAVVKKRKKIINGLEGIKEVHKWYREAKNLSESEDVPAAVTTKIIGMIFQKLSPYLEKLLIDTVNLEIEKIGQNKTKIKKVEFAIAVKPHVDFVKRFNGKEVLRARITFRFAASAKLENIKIHRNYYQDGSKERTEIEVKKFEAPFSISIYTLTFSLADVQVEPLLKPVVLYNVELLKIQDFNYYL
jgi:hypothetical protein